MAVPAAPMPPTLVVQLKFSSGAKFRIYCINSFNTKTKRMKAFCCTKICLPPSRVAFQLAASLGRRKREQTEEILFGTWPMTVPPLADTETPLRQLLSPYMCKRGNLAGIMKLTVVDQGVHHWTCQATHVVMLSLGEKYAARVQNLIKRTIISLPYSSKFSWHNIFVNFVIRHPITII